MAEPYSLPILHLKLYTSKNLDRLALLSIASQYIMTRQALVSGEKLETRKKDSPEIKTQNINVFKSKGAQNNNKKTQYIEKGSFKFSLNAQEKVGKEWTLAIRHQMAFGSTSP